MTPIPPVRSFGSSIADADIVSHARADALGSRMYGRDGNRGPFGIRFLMIPNG